MTKTGRIEIRLSPEDKRKLQYKADELGLSITELIEKIANEPIIFMDANVKQIISLMKI